MSARRRHTIDKITRLIPLIGQPVEVTAPEYAALDKSRRALGQPAGPQVRVTGVLVAIAKRISGQNTGGYDLVIADGRRYFTISVNLTTGIRPINPSTTTEETP